jgi:LmbE family N-acetylglucosaminyl deacetylase
MAGLRLLACFAHPDDEAFPVAGALAACAAQGVEVRLITATSGEEGEVRRPGLATAETLGAVRRGELAQSVRTLGLAGHQVLGYRDSGMAGTPANANPQAFVNAPAATVVEQLVAELRRFRPQVVLTFEPGGLYGHPDHIAICRHATEAFRRAHDPQLFPHQLAGGLRPHAPHRLFYSARPIGFRTETALKLRAAGVDFPMPTAQRANDGTPPEQIHFEMDVSAQLEAKMACIQCHRSQVAPDWPYHRVPRPVAADILGREHYIRAWPPVRPGELVPPDFFAGLRPWPGN